MTVTTDTATQPTADDCLCRFSYLHLDPNTRNLPAGFHGDKTYGHAILADAHRQLVTMETGLVVEVGGINVTDPKTLRDMAAHFEFLAGRLEKRLADPRNAA